MPATPNGPIAGQDAGASGYGPGTTPTGSVQAGVLGYSDSDVGVLGSSTSSNAVHIGAGSGVYGRSDGGGYAGWFQGDATVTGNISANTVSTGGNINKGGSCNSKSTIRSTPPTSISITLRSNHLT